MVILERQVICIPPKDSEFPVMNIFNAYTGEKLGQIENIKETNKRSKRAQNIQLFKG